MCRWMGSHFHHLFDYNGLLEWGRIFSGFGGKNIQASSEFCVLKNIRRFAVQK